MLPLGASPPGSASVKGILKKSGLTDPVMQNMTVNEDKIEYMPIDPKFIPPEPLTFTLNVMKYVKDEKLAEDYSDFVRSDGQEILERNGFTSVHSARGLDLIERFGVKDVQ